MKLPDFKNMQFKIPSLSFLRARETLGIDLGSTSLKIVQISKGKLVRWAYKELPPKDMSPETQAGDRNAIFTRVLTEFLTEEKGAPKAASVSISARSLSWGMAA